MKMFLQLITGKNRLAFFAGTVLALMMISTGYAQTYNLPITGTDAVRCGAGEVTLTIGWSGEALNPENVKWYTQPFYGTPFHTGLSFTTDYLEYTTPFYIDYIGEGGCSQCDRLLVRAVIADITITPQVIYPSLTYCNSSNATYAPSIVGAESGIFSVNNEALEVNPGTGAINPFNVPAGSYTVTFIPEAITGCDANPVTVNLVVTNAPVQPQISYPLSSYCSSSAAILISQTGAGGGTYSSSPSGLSINGSTGTITPATSQTGTYTVTYLVPGGGGCSPVSATTTVSILKLPTATIAYSSPFTQNQGIQPVALTGTDDYLGGAFSSTEGLTINETTGEINPSTSTAGNYTVTYTKSAVSPCSDNLVATTTVSIFGLPTAQIDVSGQPVCLDGTDPEITLTGSVGATPYTFYYTINDGATQNISSETGASNTTLAHSSLIAGIYVYKVTSVTDGNGSTRTYTSGSEPEITIIVTTPQVATFQYPNMDYCQNDTNPEPEMSGVAGTFTASPAGLAFAEGEGVASGTINLTGSNPGTYTVTNTIAATGGCNDITATFEVTIHPLPAATIAANVTDACQNGTSPVITFTGSNGTPPYLFTYKINDGTAQTVSSPVDEDKATVSLSTITNGAFVFTLEQVSDANSCEVAVTDQSVIINVNVPAIADFSYTGSPYCSISEPAVVTFATDGVAGVFSYTNSGGIASGLAGFNTETGEITIVGSTADEYTVYNTIGATGGCDIILASAILTITQLPVTAFEYAQTTYHQGQTNPAPTYLTIGGFTGVAGAFSASSPFLVFATSGDPAPAPGTINLSESQTGTYTVTNTILGGDGCATVSHNFEITITTPPTPPSISYAVGPGLLAYFCNSQAEATVLQDGETGGTYTILPATGLSVDANTGTLTTLDATPGEYTVTYTVTGFDPATAVVTIFEEVTVNAGSDIEICADGTAQLNGSLGGSALQASAPLPSAPVWSTTGDGTFSNENELSAVYTPGTTDKTTGTVTLQLLANAPQYDMGEPGNTGMYFGPCSFVTDALTLTIHPLPLAPVASNTTITYDGNPHSATATVSGGQTIVWYDAATNGNVINDISTVLTQTNAGTYTAWAEVHVTATGCISATRTEVTLTINKAELTVKADDKSKTYDGSVFSAFSSTITGYVNGEDISVVTGTPTYTGAATTATDYGTYTITPVVTGLSATNYTFAPANGELQINKVELTVKADDKSKTYDGSLFSAFSSTITGYVNGEDISVVTGTPTYTGAATTATDYGTYTITPVMTGLSATNYTFAPANGELQINKVELTVKADDKSKTYDGSVFSAFSSTITGYVNGEDISVVTGTPTYTGAATTATDYGTYTITPVVTGLSATNYTFAPANGELQINKVELTVKADDKSKTYDGSLFSAFSSTITGFVNGEDISAVTGTPTYTGAATTATEYGAYTITPVVTGLSATNYTFAPASGELQINKAELTVKADDKVKGVNADDPELTVTYTGFMGDENTSSLDGTLSVTRTAGEVVGTYTITASGLTSGNYTITYQPGTLTIAEVIVEATLGTARSAYNTLDGAFSAINNGVHNGEIAIRVYADTSEPEGGATLAPSGTGLADYTSVSIIAENNVTIDGGVTLGE
jgi:hypothetical protein